MTHDARRRIASEGALRRCSNSVCGFPNPATGGDGTLADWVGLAGQVPDAGPKSHLSRA